MVRLHEMPQGRSLFPHGHNLSVFQNSAMWLDKDYSEALKEEESRGREIHIFLDRVPSDSRELILPGGHKAHSVPVISFA